jgi:hypothetical protein
MKDYCPWESEMWNIIAGLGLVWLGLEIIRYGYLYEG